MIDRCRICRCALIPKAAVCQVCSAPVGMSGSSLRGRPFAVWAACLMMAAGYLFWPFGMIIAFLSLFGPSLLAIWWIGLFFLWPFLLINIDMGIHADAPRIIKLSVINLCLAVVTVPVASLTFAWFDETYASAPFCMAWSALLTAALCRHAWRIHRRPLAGQNPLECHRCGYFLYGLDNPRCPECGTSLQRIHRQK